jgi:hypothetical protein
MKMEAIFSRVSVVAMLDPLHHELLDAMQQRLPFRTGSANSTIRLQRSGQHGDQHEQD